MAFNIVPQPNEQPQRHLLNKMHCAENKNKNYKKKSEIIIYKTTA